MYARCGISSRCVAAEFPELKALANSKREVLTRRRFHAARVAESYAESVRAVGAFCGRQVALP